MIKRRSRMAAISVDPRLNLQMGANDNNKHGPVVEEIEGLIRVHKDGHVDRPPIIPTVPPTAAPCPGVASKDIVIEKCTNLWARVYVPSCPGKLPLLVYFHGGGFCVGSAAWSCYHDFLSNLASKAGCVIMSVNYRLAPETRLPGAYDDGVNTLLWIKQQVQNGNPSDHSWWLSHCNVSNLFLAGDSAGANIAYNVATRVLSNKANESNSLGPLCINGAVLIQPFFGGEARTPSEKYSSQPPNSALSLPASDVYWRLSLPAGTGRDHPWCNPLARGGAELREVRIPATMVCVSEMDILKDRELEFGKAMAGAGKKVETVICRGVGHAFQVLHNSQLSQARTQELMSHIKAFIS